MNSPRSTQAEKLVQTFEALPKREQKKVFLRLAQSSKIQDELEDLVDIAIAEQREKEPRIPLEEVLADLKRRR